MILAISYKNFAASKAISHIGLGVAALNIAKVLRATGVEAHVWPVNSADDIEGALATLPTVTHLVISAPWVPTSDLQRLTLAHPNLQIALNIHSNVAFLGADLRGVTLIREALALSRGTWNFKVAANSDKGKRWLEQVYRVPCLLLPNLYDLSDMAPRYSRPLWMPGEVLRVGIYGAVRPLKNAVTGAGAVLELAAVLKAQVELHLSAGRSEGGGAGIRQVIGELYRDLPWAKVIDDPWTTWPNFRQQVSHMHLLIQVSHTESFNMVTADGVAEGVPSVVSTAIPWAPAHWKAEVDDALEVARRGRYLLGDREAASEGLAALKNHNSASIESWHLFLNQSLSSAALYPNTLK